MEDGVKLATLDDFNGCCCFESKNLFMLSQDLLSWLKTARGASLLPPDMNTAKRQILNQLQTILPSLLADVA